MNTTDPL